MHKRRAAEPAPVVQTSLAPTDTATTDAKATAAEATGTCRLLLSQSYILRLDPKEQRAMAPYPPLGTLFAASVLRQAGHEVNLFDAMLTDGPEQIDRMLDRVAPDLLVIYDDDFNYLTKMCLTRMRGAAFRMIAAARERDIPVAIHSSDATDRKEAYFEAGVNFLLVGESERTLRELADLLGSMKSRGAESAEIFRLDATTIPGIHQRQAEGTIVSGLPRRAERDLDTFPFPSRDLVDIDRYRRIWRKRHGRFSMNMVTTRGCPFHCNWCAKPLYGQRYASRSPANVVAEIVTLAERYEPDHLWFCDDIFGLRPGWVETFADELEQAGLRIPYKALSRADLLLRGATIEGLARSGCETIWIGAESGAQSVLDAMDKGTTLAEIAEARRQLGAHGIRVGFFLQFGYPGEQADEVAATVAMVRALMPDEIGISVSYPLPGTPFHDRVVAEMGEHHNWQESADLAMMFRGSYTTDYYRALAAWLHKDHRLRLARNGIAKLLGGSHGRSGSIPWRRILLLPWYVTMRRLYRSKMRRSGGPFQFDAAEKWVFEGGGDETARADDPTVVGDAAQGGTVPETADLAQSNSVASDPITSINLRR